MHDKPRILRTGTIAKTRVFHVEEVELEFSNGNVVTYERLAGSARGAVMVVPMLDVDTTLLIREYAAGVDRYEVAFPKGLIEGSESPLDSANREIKEEIGYGARQLTHLRSMSLAPGYQKFETHVVLAEDLYEERLSGDEPEEIEVIPWRLDETEKLLQRGDFTEARSIAALFLVKELMLSRQGGQT